MKEGFAVEDGRVIEEGEEEFDLSANLSAVRNMSFSDNSSEGLLQASVRKAGGDEINNSHHVVSATDSEVMELPRTEQPVAQFSARGRFNPC